MTYEEFLEAAEKQFGDKIVVKQLNFSDEDAEKLGLDPDALRAYPAQAWIPLTDGQYRCPHCDEPLGGMFGSFEWGIQHGVGYCSNCNRVEFRYYHYIDEQRLELFAVSSFRKED